MAIVILHLGDTEYGYMRRKKRVHAREALNMIQLPTLAF